MAEKRKRRVRAVDAAMTAVRSEKVTIRKLWIKALKAYDQKHPNSQELLYVTLPGAEGHEIELLAKEKLIKLTELGGIAQELMKRVAAIESNKMAVGTLQKKYPGLKIYETNFAGLIHGDGLLVYPTGEHRDCCRARVLNLDLNEVLTATESSFPILTWIQKLGEIHAAAPRIDWCLYLTLHGEVRWTSEVSNSIRQFLRENFVRAQKFSDLARLVLGEKLFNDVYSNNQVDFSGLERELQQKILMTFVPKKIADLVRPQMWRLDTKVNLRYGRPGRAPMVTWIIDFISDARAAATPDAVYIDSVNGILTSAGSIDDKGKIALELP